MNHRDEILIRKIISEIDIANEMMGTIAYDQFKDNELLKRAICMTIIEYSRKLMNNKECENRGKGHRENG